MKFFILLPFLLVLTLAIPQEKSEKIEAVAETESVEDVAETDLESPELRTVVETAETANKDQKILEDTLLRTQQEYLEAIRARTQIHPELLPETAAEQEYYQEE